MSINMCYYSNYEGEAVIFNSNIVSMCSIKQHYGSVDII